MNTIAKEIEKYRVTPVVGKCIDLVPLKENMLENVVALRNQERCVYFLNQGQKLTLDGQNAWYASYLERKDDIYWAIVNKSGEMVGTNRLYQITNEKCTQGSFIIDENRTAEAPYALEATLLALKFAFEELHVKTIINEDRTDNKMMKSISKRVGFKYLCNVDIRGVTYCHYELVQEDFKNEKLEELLERWMQR